MSVPVGSLTAVFIADSEDAAHVLPEAGQVLLDNADLLSDATEVWFIYKKSTGWEFQHKCTTSGNVLMSRECFDRTMSTLTDTRSIIYPEQMEHIKLRYSLSDYPTSEYSCETQLEYRSPAGNFIKARAAKAQFISDGVMLTFRNGETWFIAIEDATQSKETAKRAWQRSQELRGSDPNEQ